MGTTDPVAKGKKRARNGKEIQQQEKPQGQTKAQQPRPTPKNWSNGSPNNAASLPRNPHNGSKPKHKRQKQNRTPNPTCSNQPPKLPRLPDHASISKRPLHRPALPTPFSSSDSPKCIYVNSSSPFIPAVKRIRALLSEIEKRETQSLSSLSKRTHLQANGRLDPKAVERGIAEGVAEGDRAGVGAEEVFVKGSGKAIERALEIGVYFQKEADCRVRVSIGSVKAIDDIELGAKKEEDEVEAAVENEDSQEMIVDQDDGQKKNPGQEKRKRKGMKDEDVPETRIRTLSVVTVAISLR